MIMLRIRSRDGLERVRVEGPHTTVSQLKTLIQDQLAAQLHAESELKEACDQ